MDSVPQEPMCVCGHPQAAHEHYRRGSDCSLCADGSCRRYRAASASGRPVIARLLGRLRGR